MKRDSFTVCEAYRMSENWMNRCDSFPPHRICTFCMQILDMYAFMQGSFREFDEDSFISFISDVKKSGCVCSAPLQKDAFTCSKSLFFCLSLTRGIRLVLFTRLKRLCRASNSISFTSAFNCSSFCRSSLSSFIRRSIRARWCKSSAKEETYSINTSLQEWTTLPHIHPTLMHTNMINRCKGVA